MPAQPKQFDSTPLTDEYHGPPPVFHPLMGTSVFLGPTSNFLRPALKPTH